MSEAPHVVKMEARRTAGYAEAAANTAPFAASPFVECYRLLALNVQCALGVSSGQSIVLLSAEDDDGRSLTAACLAGALAELGSPVVLVDSNPTGSGHFALKVPAPFSPAVLNVLKTVLQSHEPVRGLLTSRPDFIEHVTAVMDNATASGMVAVIDASPCSKSSIAFSLAARATGVIYVARRRVRDRRVHEEIRAQLDRIGAHVLGLVFNEA